MEMEIAKCKICGKTELMPDFRGRIGGLGIYLDSRRSKDMEIARKMGIGKDALDSLKAVLYSGYCDDCLRREREISMKKSKVYCSRSEHGRHYTWSRQFWKCSNKGRLIFNESELYEMGLI